MVCLLLKDNPTIQPHCSIFICCLMFAIIIYMKSLSLSRICFAIILQIIPSLLENPPKTSLFRCCRSLFYSSIKKWVWEVILQQIWVELYEPEEWELSIKDKCLEVYSADAGKCFFWVLFGSRKKGKLWCIFFLGWQQLF